MNKRIIRLTESDLHRIVNESVSRILKEETVIKGKTFEYNGEKYILDVFYTSLSNAHFRCRIRTEDGKECATDDGLYVEYSAIYKALKYFVYRSKGSRTANKNLRKTMKK